MVYNNQQIQLFLLYSFSVTFLQWDDDFLFDEANNGLDARFQQKSHDQTDDQVHKQKDKEVQNDVETVKIFSLQI